MNEYDTEYPLFLLLNFQPLFVLSIKIVPTHWEKPEYTKKHKENLFKSLQFYNPTILKL